MSVQAKLLRVVEEKEFERVGGTRTLQGGRAHHRRHQPGPRGGDRQRNEFREDLYYRLNIIPIVLPPLRERREDIPYLVAALPGQDQPRPGPAAQGARPGGARPLRRLLLAGQRARAGGGDPPRLRALEPATSLTVADFGWIALQVQGPPAAPAGRRTRPACRRRSSLADGGYEEALERYDRQLIAAALAQCGGKIRETARLLGIARNTLRAKMKKLRPERDGSGEAA